MKTLNPESYKCKNCDCLKYVFDVHSSERTCVSCGTVNPVLTIDRETLTYSDFDSYSYDTSTFIESKASFKQLRDKHVEINNNNYTPKTKDSLNTVRKKKRFEQIMRVVNSKTDELGLSCGDLSRIRVIHNKLSVACYPRPIELHALILIALATRESSQISYQRICEKSDTVSSKNLISFVKTICDSLNIPRPTSDPKIMINKHVTMLGLSRKQRLHTFKKLGELMEKYPSLHPMTHMSLAIMISISKVDIEHSNKYSITPQKIAQVVGTTVSTLMTKYDTLVVMKSV